MKYASILKRFFANAIDNLLVIIPFYCIIFSLVIVGAILSNDQTEEQENITMVIILAIMFAAFVFVCFIFILWAWFTSNSKYMGTPGKMILGIKVVTEEGEKLTFGQALVREAVKSFFSPYVFITAFFTDKKQSVHDILVKSVVVEK